MKLIIGLALKVEWVLEKTEGTETVDYTND